jgi:general secretion pathway protein I
LNQPATANRTRDGFTLIEALVALVIVAVSLSSIGALIATTVRGTRTIEAHLMRLETARAVATALPDRDQLAPGKLMGEIAGHRWRMEVHPFVETDFGTVRSASWVPLTVIVTVLSLTGAPLQISTVRLQHSTRGS